MDTVKMVEKIKGQYGRTLEDNPELKRQIGYITKRLDLTPEAFLEGFLRYDTGRLTNDNSVYKDIFIRCGMYFKHYIKDSYHPERQNILLNMVNACQGVNTLIDIGYGIPGKYVFEVLRHYRNIYITLLDRYESARIFTEALFSCTATNWHNSVTLGEFDMNKNKSPGAFDLYIFFDSIEHARDPDKFFSSVLDTAPSGSYFIFSIPIEKAKISGGSEEEPMHFMEWVTEADARDWVTMHGLTILEEAVAKPKSGDFWIESSDIFHNLIVRSQKL